MQNLDRKTPIILLHLLGSISFISIPIFSSPDFSSGHLFNIAAFQRNLFTYILLLVFFYFNYLYLLSKYYFGKKHLTYFIFILIFYVIINFLPSLLIENTAQSVTIPNRPISSGANQLPVIVPTVTSGPLFSFLLVFLIGFLLKINQRLAQMQSDKLKTEVSYLKAQINPHFLFNTLNSVYALTLEKSDLAPEAILKLSAMMRYVVTESSLESVSLEKEMGYIKSYISLQQLRMDKETEFSFDINGDPSGKSISPLVIIPFIENAFKYGLNPEEKSQIDIKIDITDSELKLMVENKKVNVTIPQEEKSEQGIENTRKRLQYLYPDKHKLIIFDKEEIFTVNLSIILV